MREKCKTALAQRSRQRQRRAFHRERGLDLKRALICRRMLRVILLLHINKGVYFSEFRGDEARRRLFYRARGEKEFRTRDANEASRAWRARFCELGLFGFHDVQLYTWALLLIFFAWSRRAAALNDRYYIFFLPWNFGAEMHNAFYEHYAKCTSREPAACKIQTNKSLHNLPSSVHK